MEVSSSWKKLSDKLLTLFVNYSQDVRAPLVKSLSKAATALLSFEQNVEKYTEADTDALLRMSRSAIEYEIMAAINGPSEDAITISRTMSGLSMQSKELDGPYVDWDGSNVDTSAAASLDKIRSTLKSLVSAGGQITEEVCWIETPSYCIF
jgi:hypothetical protein